MLNADSEIGWGTTREQFMAYLEQQARHLWPYWHVSVAGDLHQPHLFHVFVQMKNHLVVECPVTFFECRWRNGNDVQQLLTSRFEDSLSYLTMEPDKSD